jgi:hypothetical protein
VWKRFKSWNFFGRTVATRRKDTISVSRSLPTSLKNSSKPGYHNQLVLRSAAWELSVE